jgi:dethiobiotin synthetase
VVVALGGLGTLNHTLLTCEALMLRGWRVAAVLVNPGADGSSDTAAGNAEILARFLPVPVHLFED